MNMLKIAKIIIDIVPVTIKLVNILNDLIPEAKKGKEKFEILITILKSILEQAEDATEEIIEIIIKIVDKIVSGFVKIKKEIHGAF